MKKKVIRTAQSYVDDIYYFMSGKVDKEAKEEIYDALAELRLILTPS